MLTARLSWRMITRRRGPTSMLFSAAAVLGLMLACFVTIKSTVQAAVVSSVTTDSAGRAYVLQAADPAARDAMRAVPGMRTITDSTVVVERGGRAVNASLREANHRDAVPLLILAGRAPERSAEVAVTSEMARLLDASLGASVQVREGERAFQRTVVGIGADVADRKAMRLVGIGDADPSEAVSFVSFQYPVEDSRLLALLERRQGSFRTTGLLAAERAEDTWYKLLPGWEQLDRWFWLVASALLGVLMHSGVRTIRPDVAGLRAAGLSSRRSWLVPSLASLSVVTAGSAVGAAAGVAVVWGLRDPLAHALGQRWLNVHPPTLVLSQQILLVVALLGLVQAVMIGQIGSRRGSFRLPSGVGTLSTAVGALLLVMASSRLLTVQLALPGALLMAFGVCGLVSRVLLMRSSRSRQAVHRHFATPMFLLSSVLALLVCYTSFQSAYTVHGVLFSDRASPEIQPEGSLLLNPVPKAAVSRLHQSYNGLQGNVFVAHAMPDDGDREIDVRVTGTQAVACVESMNKPMLFELPDSCMPQGTLVPVNTLAIDSSAAKEDAIRADPALITDGQVGVLAIDRRTGQVLDTVVAQATPDATLGGNMPGAVLAAVDAIANRFDLKASEAYTVGLLDFSKLTQPNQAAMRASAMRLAPTAVLAENDNRELEYENQLANGIAAFGAAASGLLIITLGGGILIGQRRDQQLLLAAGASRRDLRLLRRQVLFIAATTFVIASLLGRWAAWVAGIHDGSGFGWTWTLPALAAVMALVLLVPDRRSFARV